MKISYNWLKSYIPEIPDIEKLADIFIYHLCEIEGIEKKTNDTIFDLNILPNRAHDLLSHQGVARELASLLNIKCLDPTSLYKIPKSKSTDLRVEIQSHKCRRYMSRIIKGVKVGPSPIWVKEHLESIGQRSINNIVDAANIVMFDCGQPIHCFDLDKVHGKIIIREANEGEQITTLDNKEIKLKQSDVVVADDKFVLAIAGIKGGKIAEVDRNTKNIIVEVANFDPITVRKTAKNINLFTDAVKRFENDLSPELCDFAMLEISALIAEYGATDFEEIIDIYPQKQEKKKFSFSTDKISKILGVNISQKEVESILGWYNFEYTENKGIFEITIPFIRLDLIIEEDIAEEIGRILGYDKVKPKIPKINFTSNKNEVFYKISWARNKLLDEGYHEVMNYVFRDIGQVEVLASASDKKFLRTNLIDGLKESLKLNQLNAPLLEMNDIKIFEIGTVFKKDKEEVSVAFGSKKEIKEMSLEEFCKSASSHHLQECKDLAYVNNTIKTFKMWSVYPFISRDISVWIPEGESEKKLKKILIENSTELLIKEPYIFDSFTKDDRTSYAFRLVFQSYERTLRDEEVNKIMKKISHKIGENSSWQIR
jgi:phenylalanyl-tRNA synthetase beta chain